MEKKEIALRLIEIINLLEVADEVLTALSLSGLEKAMKSMLIKETNIEPPAFAFGLTGEEAVKRFRDHYNHLHGDSE